MWKGIPGAVLRNPFLPSKQFMAVEDRWNRLPDVVLFINGLPLAVIKLKNLADEQLGEPLLCRAPTGALGRL